MTTQKNAAQVAAQAEPCQEQRRIEAIDRMMALQSIANGLVSGLMAYQEVVRIDQCHKAITDNCTIKPPQGLKPRNDLADSYRLEDLADAFTQLVQLQGDALHVITETA